MNRLAKPNHKTDHQYFEQRLSAYLDGELLPQELDAVKHHLATCQACQWDLSTLRQTVQWTRELPVLPVPRVFTVRVPAQPERASRWRFGILPVLQGATVLVALLLFFAVAGDFWLGSFRAPMPQTLQEAAPLAVEITKVVEAVQEAPAEERAVVETVVAKEMVVTLEVARAEAEATPTPAPAPAEVPRAPTMAPEATGIGAGESKEGETTAKPEADQTVGVAAPPPSAKQPGTATAQAEPTATMVPTAPALLSVPAEPTVVAEAEVQEESLDARQERELTAGRREPGILWLRVVEAGLTVALLVLVVVTFLLIIQRRRAR